MSKISISRITNILWSTLLGMASFLISGVMACIEILLLDNYILATLIAGGTGGFFFSIFLRKRKMIGKMTIAGLAAVPVGFWSAFTLAEGFFSISFLQVPGNIQNVIAVVLMSILCGVVFGAIVYGRKAIWLFSVVCGIVSFIFWFLAAVPKPEHWMGEWLENMTFFGKIDLTLLEIILSFGIGIGLSIGLYEMLKQRRPDFIFYRKEGIILTCCLFVLGILVLLFFLSQSPYKKGLSYEEAGTLENGILNNGWVSETEDYIFYINRYSNSHNQEELDFDNVLIRRDRDWTNRTELTESSVEEFVVDENYIYYTDESENNHLYRMNDNGGEVILVSDENIKSLTVSDGIIYYSTSDGIYKLDYINNELMKLSSSGYGLFVNKDWVYYFVNEDWKYGCSNSLSRVKIDGTEDQKLLDGINDYYIAADAIYYIREEEAPYGLFTITLYKQAFDTAEETEIVTIEHVDTAMLDGDYLYYTLFAEDEEGAYVGDGTYRINLDGTGTEMKTKVSIGHFDTIQGDWAYFPGMNNGYTDRVKLDGSVAVHLN